MFVCFLHCFQLVAQSRPISTVTDSLLLVNVDSLQQIHQAQDSLSRQYVFHGITKGDPMLDSLRKNITVVGNDFLRWMKFMNSLEKHSLMSKDEALVKNSRPMWVLVVLSVLLLGIGAVKMVFPKVFQKIVVAYYDEQMLYNLNKEDNMMTSWPYIFLYILFSFSLALFLLIYISSFHDAYVLTLENFFKLAAFVAVLFILKILLLRFISLVFELERMVREYIAVLYLVYFNSMLILIPILVIVTFAPVSYFKFLLIFFALIVSGLFLYRFFRTAIRLVGQLKFSIFYLILYLCSLEIAPILILVKTLNS